MSFIRHRTRNTRSHSVACMAGGGAGSIAISLLVLLTLGPSPARAGRDDPDWATLADVRVIEVLSEDADGDTRETKVWFVLVGGQPYLRTNGSRWLENIRRDPDIRLRIEGREYEARATEIPGDEIVERVDAASAEKYGWQEKLIHIFRIKRPQILLVSPRDA